MLVVALTAFAMKLDEDRALEAGCDAFVPKPIDTRILPGMLADLLSRSPPAPDAPAGCLNPAVSVTGTLQDHYRHSAAMSAFSARALLPVVMVSPLSRPGGRSSWKEACGLGVSCPPKGPANPGENLRG